MEREELQALLRAGILAIKAGDREGGRELLLRVVEADERSEPAWLWLSAAVDDPADQLVALENVLAVNPTHAQALAGMRALRQQLGIAESTAPAAPEETRQPVHPPTALPAIAGPKESEPAPITPAPVLFAALPEDDPYQCPYCGRQTEPEDTRCRHCRRGLLVSRLWRGGPYLYFILILVGLHLQSGLVQAAAVYGYENFPRFASLIPASDIWAANLVGPAVMRMVLWALVLLALLNESFGSYRTAALVAAADLAWLGTGAALGHIGQLLAVFNAGASGLVLVLALLALVSEHQSRVRLRTEPDRNVHGAHEYDKHAEAHARAGRWALAAMHWRKAVALQPRQPAYYKSLGRAQARIGRLDEARRAWSSGAELAPADPDFPRLLANLKG